MGATDINPATGTVELNTPEDELLADTTAKLKASFNAVVGYCRLGEEQRTLGDVHQAFLQTSLEDVPIPVFPPPSSSLAEVNKELRKMKALSGLTSALLRDAEESAACQEDVQKWVECSRGLGQFVEKWLQSQDKVGEAKDLYEQISGTIMRLEFPSILLRRLAQNRINPTEIANQEIRQNLSAFVEECTDLSSKYDQAREMLAQSRMSVFEPDPGDETVVSGPLSEVVQHIAGLWDDSGGNGGLGHLKLEDVREIEIDGRLKNIFEEIGQIRQEVELSPSPGKAKQWSEFCDVSKDRYLHAIREARQVIEELEIAREKLEGLHANPLNIEKFQLGLCTLKATLDLSNTIAQRLTRLLEQHSDEADSQESYDRLLSARSDLESEQKQARISEELAKIKLQGARDNDLSQVKATEKLSQLSTPLLTSVGTLEFATWKKDFEEVMDNIKDKPHMMLRCLKSAVEGSRQANPLVRHSSDYQEAMQCLEREFANSLQLPPVILAELNKLPKAQCQASESKMIQKFNNYMKLFHRLTNGDLSKKSEVRTLGVIFQINSNLLSHNGDRYHRRRVEKDIGGWPCELQFQDFEEFLNQIVMTNRGLVLGEQLRSAHGQGKYPDDKKPPPASWR